MAGCVDANVRIDSPRVLLIWLARLALTIALVILIATRLDFELFTQEIIAPQWLPLIGMALAGVGFIFLGGVKLWLLVRGLTPVRLGLFLLYFFLGGAIGSLAPALFGDVSIVALARRDGVPLRHMISTILVDRAITLSVIVWLFLPGALGLIWREFAWMFWALSGLSILGLGVGVWWFAQRAFAWQRFPRLAQFAQVFGEFARQQPRPVLANLLLTVARGILSGVSLQLVLLAVMPTSSEWFTTICLANSLSILNLLPITLGGAGIYEGGGMVLFEIAGLPREQVFAALVYQRLYILASSVLIIAVAFGLLAYVKRIGWTLIEPAPGEMSNGENTHVR